MKPFSFTLVVLFCFVTTRDSAAQSERYDKAGPQYSSDKTKQLVEKMLEAHGGLDAWKTAPSFQFTSVMYLAALPVKDGRRYFDNWRNYRVAVNPQTNVGYVNIEYEDRTSPSIGFDGHEVWQVDYSFDPAYQDGAFMMLYFHYGMLALPWMSQEPGVVLTYLDRAVLPLSDVEFHRVRMTFETASNEETGYIDFYIHPETFLVSGWNGTSPYPLFPGGEFTDILSGNSPGVVRMVEEHSRVGKLIIPRAYTTIRVAEDGSETMMGSHLVVNPTLSEKLDESLISKPSSASVVKTVN